jgi:DNA repair ATPase RecN
MLLIFGALLPLNTNLKAQSHEVQQLLLNVQKLNQLKQILQNMYSGYEILTKGYNAIKDISEGNFNLHQAFLDGLMAVNPSVQKYKRIADIIDYQQQIVKNYKIAISRFRNDPHFNAEEIKYLESVYENLFKESLKSLDELMMVITANKLRMSDDERILAIDRIFEDMEFKLIFLKQFNSSTEYLALQRAKESGEINFSRQLYGINN